MRCMPPSHHPPAPPIIAPRPRVRPGSLINDKRPCDDARARLRLCLSARATHRRLIALHHHRHQPLHLHLCLVL